MKNRLSTVVAAIAAAIALLLVLRVPVGAEAATITIWPVNPVVSSRDRATAVWMENRGTSPATMQVRLLRWDIENFDNHYVEQEDIVVSPPIATVAPGARQLLRLIKVRPIPAGTEQAYRVFIDQLPDPAAPQPTSANTTSMGVTFRMRYSLPLFAYGEGLEPVDRRTEAGAAAAAAGTSLSWRIVEDDGARWLEIRNAGTRHARLTDVRLITPDARTPLANGLLGYVLPGRTMRWPVTAESQAVALELSVNGLPMTLGAGQ
jgi:fimbrial chaperone protein